MINCHYECEFRLNHEAKVAQWITNYVVGRGKFIGQIDYVFCDDRYLHSINLHYLKHDELTDIITFDYVDGDELSGDIFISIERVKDNAITFDTQFYEEVLRVMAHGILHLMGYKDKSKEEQKEMRIKENEMIELFHVEL
ncbi:rRNA maturation RNase YbeY [Arenibacter sp. GZD96]|uniref:rRNA maturation RNase YbeY n=1 Tax=Aurantibrevibacter litoralis TaxID=3106030 RepID=UPI002B001D69|nr:rRNA maturation RNase YbeY [Arenibacter sp. GZD-96]MEA1786469.1 rRNA maturation RNase YbeY [Arenibacter sp. GZD-96]